MQKYDFESPNPLFLRRHMHMITLSFVMKLKLGSHGAVRLTQTTESIHVNAKSNEHYSNTAET